MNREYTNLLKNCKNLWFAVLFFFFFINRIFARLVRKYCPTDFFYSKSVKAAKRQLAIINLKLVLTRLGSENVPKDITVKLAIGSLNIEGDQAWLRHFEDGEQESALHRFGYLLLWITEDQKSLSQLRQDGLWLMESWCRVMMQNTTGVAWESYAVGERICNSLWFFAFLEGDGLLVSELPCIPEPFAHYLLFQAHYLANYLEYHETQATGNHVLNNARALYFCGQALKQMGLSAIARAIFKNDVHTIISTDGFLREGSSHYQFLVTRWLLEVLWIAQKSGDQKVQQLLEPIVKKMVERCWFFLIFDETAQEWTIPLVGDVSPDFSWKWLLHLPWSKLALQYYQPDILPSAPVQKGWSRLFGVNDINEGKQCLVTKQQTPKLQEFSQSGWYRLDFGSLTMIWHIEPTGTPFYSSHGHCDTGSFSLYWHGQAVLIDTGRLNYRLYDGVGQEALSAKAHNSIQIDGFDPFVYYYRSRFPKNYLQHAVKVTSKVEAECVRFSVYHEGFSRIAGDNIQFTRTFLIFKDHIKITDSFQGKKQHEISTFFQWGPGCQVNQLHDKSFWIQGKKFKGKLKIVENHEYIADISGKWSCLQYGQKQDISRLTVQQSIPFPCENTYVLEVG